MLKDINIHNTSRLFYRVYAKHIKETIYYRLLHDYHLYRLLLPYLPLIKNHQTYFYPQQHSYSF
ncbi:hypothetical protein C7M52_01148 [Mixta theicola]|nr:hypothetical protein C7M52_01148 [Mixta theicola]